MAVRFKWLIINRVRLVTLSNKATLDDFEQVINTHRNWLLTENATSPIHYIADFRAVESYPRSVSLIRQRVSGKLRNIGWVAVLCNDYYLTHLIRIFARLLSFRMHVFNTMTEAQTFLQSIDEFEDGSQWNDALDDTQPT